MVTSHETPATERCFRPMCPTCYPVNVVAEEPTPEPAEEDEGRKVRSGTRAQQAEDAIFAATGVRVTIDGVKNEPA